MNDKVPRKLAIYTRLERAMGRERLYKLGRFLYLGARRELLNEPHVNGEYALIRWVLGAGGDTAATPMIFDVGANIGDWTAEALQAMSAAPTGSKGCVHAFEPAPAQRATLSSRHAASITAGRLYVHDCAVGAEAGRVRFEITGHDSGTSAIAPGGIVAAGGGATAASVIEVEVKTIDALTADLEVDRIMLLKVDTEGNDFNVIRGAHGLLSAGQIGVLQFEYNWRWIEFGHCLKTVFEFSKGLDYALGALTQDGIEVYDRWHPELDRFNETNYVFVRRDLLGRLPHRFMTFSDANVPRITAVGVG